jgi:hypothetical protein
VVFGVVVAIVVVAAIIAVCVFVLYRTGPNRDKRVFGPPIPGDELTQHERDVALDNLTIMNQQSILRENGNFPPG